MTYNYTVKNSNGTTQSKTNLDNKGKIAYHKVRDKTLLDFFLNKESEGCTSIPRASAVTLYPRLTAFLDEEDMTEIFKSMPQRLRNELSADILLNEEQKPLLKTKKLLKGAIYGDYDSDLSVSDVSLSDNDRYLFMHGASKKTIQCN